MRKSPPSSIVARKALLKLGSDIHDARRRRRLPMELMAERAMISRATLGKVEKGDPAVSIGIYASVLHVLGMVERLSDIADVRNDETGLACEEEHLPKRIHLSPKSKKSES